MAAVAQNPDLTALEPVKADALQLAAFVQQFGIATDEDYTAAGTALNDVKDRWKLVEAKRKELLKPIDDARKGIQDFFKTALDPLSRAEAVLKGRMIGYQQAKAVAAQQAQLRLEASRQAESDRLRKEAEWADAMGDEDAAESLGLAAAVTDATSVTVDEAAPRVAGISQRTSWRWELVDLRAFVEAWLSGKVPDGFVTIDEQALGAYVRATKDKANFPGVRVYPEAVLAAGRG